MLGPFQNLIAGGLEPLARNRSQEKCLSQEGNGLTHQGHIPAKRCSVSPGSGDKDTEQAFLWSSRLWRNCYKTWHEPLKKPNQTKVVLKNLNGNPVFSHSLLLLVRVRVLVPGCLLLRDKALVERRNQGIALQVRTDDNQLLTAVQEQGAALLR